VDPGDFNEGLDGEVTKFLGVGTIRKQLDHSPVIATFRLVEARQVSSPEGAPPTRTLERTVRSPEGW